MMSDGNRLQTFVGSDLAITGFRGNTFPDKTIVNEEFMQNTNYLGFLYEELYCIRVLDYSTQQILSTDKIIILVNKLKNERKKKSAKSSSSKRQEFLNKLFCGIADKTAFHYHFYIVALRI